MQKHRGDVAKELAKPAAGAFNSCRQMRFEDGGSAIIRFPQPGNISFPEEKANKKVAVMWYLAKYTLIPAPVVMHYGMSDESPVGMDPFVLMEYISHAHNMTTSIKIPGLKR